MHSNFPDSTRRLGEIKRKEADDLAQLLSQQYQIPYTDLSVVPVHPEALSLLDETVVRQALVAPFNVVGKTVHVAILTPNNVHVKEVLALLREKGFKPEIYITSMHSLETAWARYKEITHGAESAVGLVEIDEKKLAELLPQLKNIQALGKLLTEQQQSNSIQNTSLILETIITGALSTKASDIHVEPEEAGVRLRLRLDGVLHVISTLSENTYHFILSRIKLLSELTLNIKNEAQNGRFTIRVNNRDIEVRTAISPGNYGENIVMRVLDPDTVSLDIEKIGIHPVILERIKKEIEKPNGLLLNTGPTGSGKSTTLYSFLKYVNSSESKIITIEDPIEYHLAGITQTQVDEKYSFLDGLKAALRQDPDIIMVGEIRDSDTAVTAVNAALTGHLIFSTLHTNNAAGTIPRLLGLNADIKVLGDALTVMMAQRLVRKLCEKCKEEYIPDETEWALIQKAVSEIPESFKQYVPDSSQKKLWRGKGCDECNNTGYKGRLGIYEVIFVDPAVEAVILTGPSERDVWTAAHDQGVPRLKGDGVIKVLSGITDLKELGRVVDLAEE
jgi:type IV pilus assembly protein PilB